MIYALFNVRSPAPPIIALVGLLGILAGEQIPPLVRQVFNLNPTSTSWLHEQVKHMLASCPSAPRRSSRHVPRRRPAMAETGTPDLVLHRGRFTTLDRSNPGASAVAIKDGRFTHVGRDEDIVPLAGGKTRVIDLVGKRVLPGLIDNHLHIIRGGLNFNLELRWDGVRSLADAMACSSARWPSRRRRKGCAW